MSGEGSSVPLTEKAALADLVTWAEKRPAWQRDALRRLVTGETLDDLGIAELTKLCLDPARTHTPIAQSHIVAETSAAQPISLFRSRTPPPSTHLPASKSYHLNLLD